MFNQAADTLYTRARDRGRWGLLWSALTGRPRGLLALDQLAASSTERSHRYDGIRMVPIRQIRGSEGRSQDFDRHFNPLQEHNRGRWLRVAAARQQGKVLPPVELIQIGDIYFVRDGHHRISVAQALGDQHIEAKVMVWQVSGPLPSETPARSSDMALRTATTV